MLDELKMLLKQGHLKMRGGIGCWEERLNTLPDCCPARINSTCLVQGLDELDASDAASMREGAFSILIGCG